MTGSLYIGCVVIGICYGVRIVVTVPNACELFGLKHYGLIYNILIFNLPLCSFLFSSLLAGLLYDAQAIKTDSGSNTCISAHYYRLVFVVMAATCIVGFGLNVFLLIRIRSLHSKIYVSRRSNKTVVLS